MDKASINTGFRVGDRVQVPAWSGQWMQGNRYGSIVSVRYVAARGNYVARIKLDHAGRFARFCVDDIRHV